MDKHGLQLSDADPEKGLQVQFAMKWYGSQELTSRFKSRALISILEESARYSNRNNLRSNSAFYVDPRKVSDMRSESKAVEKALLNELAGQLRAGNLYAVGFRAGQHEPVTIPREWWTTAFINAETNSADGNGVTFSGLLVFEAAPFGSSSKEGGGAQDQQKFVATVAVDTARALSEPTIPRGRGGRPPTYDWDSFIVELVRIADMDGIATRREVVDRMYEWCCDHWPDTPDRDTVRRKVNKYSHAGIPPD